MMDRKKSSFFTENDIQPNLYLQNLETPFGPWIIGASNIGVRWIKIVDQYHFHDQPNEHTQVAAKELENYFEGKLKDFTVQTDLEGHSDFSVRVWNALKEIPYGKTITYAQMAKILGDPKCIRAAATANGRNPIPIIIPCHRVIGSDGSLTGFALGLDVKKHLLSLENPLKYVDRQMEFGF
jgi:methylated-DNA-[protein]-cysteine S-methyltransferase